LRKRARYLSLAIRFRRTASAPNDDAEGIKDLEHALGWAILELRPLEVRLNV